MKNKILLLIILFSFTKCTNDLTKEPDFISEKSIFEQKVLTEAYVAKLYNNMGFKSSNYNMATIAAAGAEYICFANWQTPNTTFTRTYSETTGAGPLDYWTYGSIRELNYLIENIGQSSTFEQSYIDKKINEAKFLRAFTYFEMVKRYGGVPLVSKVAQINDSDDIIYPSRSTEKEIYDFIYTELNEVISFFSSDLTLGSNGAADKYAALALQSRAMLYAASIAKNGTVQLNGLVGIDPSEANAYYQKSLDASKQIIDSGKFQLFNRYEDKTENYIQLFLEEANEEVIFAEVFIPIVKGHALDNYSTPQGFNATWNSNFPVIYDFVELFNFTDGRSGKSILRTDLNDTNLWDINDFFGNRDPRLKASVFYPEYEYQGQKAYFHVNTTYTNALGEKVTQTSGTLDRDGESWPAAAPSRNVRNTSLLLRKRLDESNTEPLSNNSGQDFYVFRYAETLLNYAEAAFYLGLNEEGLSKLNEVRNRVGMPEKVELTEDFIRNERQVELAFEDHRYWDLVRWRTAVETLDGVRNAGLVFKYNLDEDKYNITIKNAENSNRYFGEELYYMPISIGRLNENPNMVQNPGY